MKKNVDDNYFIYKDLAYRSLIFNVIEFLYKNSLSNTNIILEDMFYNGLYNSLFGTNRAFEEMMNSVRKLNDIDVVLDFNIYISDFLEKKFDYRHINVIDLHIDKTDELCVIIKHLKDCRLPHEKQNPTY